MAEEVDGGANLRYCVVTAPQKEIDNSLEATVHYFYGDGQPVGLSLELQEIIKGVDEVKAAEKALLEGTEDRGTVENRFKLSVDLTREIFFIGDTHIYYYTDSCPSGSCTTTFIWGPDRFADPLSLGIEVRPGIPYDIDSFEWTYKFPDPEMDEESDDE